MAYNTLSIAVPSGCPNNCVFCVSRMYKNASGCDIRRIDIKNAHQAYVQRMAFARDRGCETLLLTGDGEPLMKSRFIENIIGCNKCLPNPFQRIEIQTSGVQLSPNYLKKLDLLGICTIALSLSAFNDEDNDRYMRPNLTGTLYRNPTPYLCNKIVELGFTLRLCLNLTDHFDDIKKVGRHVFDSCQELGAHQLILRNLHHSDDDRPEYVCKKATRIKLQRFVRRHGVLLETLPSGKPRFSVEGISTVFDEDCMAERPDAPSRYLVLREDGKLYTRWNDKGSIVF